MPFLGYQTNPTQEPKAGPMGVKYHGKRRPVRQGYRASSQPPQGLRAIERDMQFKLPPPTFPGQQGADDQKALNAIADQMYQQGVAGIDAARGDINQVLARNLGLLQQQAKHQRGDVKRNVAEIERQTGEGISGARSGLAAQGLTGGVVEGKVEDISDAGERAEKEQRLGLYRGHLERKSNEERLRVQAERDLRQLDDTRKRMDLERKASQEEAKSRARSASRTQVQGWMGDRFNELVNAGLPESSAHAMAVEEARKFFPDVGDTAIRGFRRASARDQIGSRYKVPGGLGMERAQRLSPRKIHEINKLMSATRTTKDGSVKPHGVNIMGQVAKRYARAGGSDPEEFLGFLADSMVAQGASEVDVRQMFAKYANALSYIMSRFY